MSKKYLVILLTLVFAIPLFADRLMFENFDAATPPNPPSGWVIENTNGDSKTWATTTSHPYSTPNCIRYTYDRVNAANDWFFTGPLSLTANIPYTVGFFYRGSGTTFPERLRVWVCSSQVSTKKIGSAIYDNSSITNTVYQSDLADFSVSSTGTYCLGFECYSAANMWNLRIDDITVYVDVHDVGVDTIYSPVPDTFSINTVINPKFLVRNYGQNTGGEEVPVFCVVVRYPPSLPPETLYRCAETLRVEICTPETVWCRPCTLRLACNHKFIAWTALSTDQVPSNDKKEVAFMVDFRDVKPETILIPRDTMLWCTESIPTVVVYNTGHGTESFWTYFRILNNLMQETYFDSVYTTNLAPATRDTLEFKKYHFPPCNYTAIVWTALATDENRHNDTLAKRFTIQFKDMEVTEILAPDTVQVCHPFLVTVKVHNNSAHYIIEPCWWVYVQIEDTFGRVLDRESLHVERPIFPCETVPFVFEKHIPVPCVHIIRAWTAYPGDQDPSNDMKTKTVRAKFIDADIVSIIAPETTQVCDSFNIIVRVHNAGPHNILQPGWYTHLYIRLAAPGDNAVIHESTLVNVPIPYCETISVHFRTHITEPSHHIIYARVDYPGDQNPANDTMSKPIVAKWYDIVAVSLFNVPETVPWCETIHPKFVIHNHGQHTWPQDGWVFIEYYRNQALKFRDSAFVRGSNPCHYDTIEFSYHPDSACNHRIIAWAYFTPDQNRHNDTLFDDFVVSFIDARPLAILSPDTMLYCSTYTVGVVVHNNSTHFTMPPGWPVYIQLGPQYPPDYAFVDKPLAYCETDTVWFRIHYAEPCTHRLKAWTAYPDDQYPANDTISKQVWVKFIDAEISAIVAPETTQVCDSFDVTVKVHNAGYHNILPQGWWVYLRIVGPLLDVALWDSLPVPHSLAPCDTAYITFRKHIAEPSWHLILTKIKYPGDQNPVNDTMSKLIVAKWYDVEAIDLFNIPPEIQFCDTIYPKVVIHNNDQHTYPRDGWVFIQYYRNDTLVKRDSQQVFGSYYCHYDTITFAFHPETPCNYWAQAYAYFRPDQDPTNDVTPIRYFTVKYYDFEAVALLGVPDTIEYCNTVTCSLIVHNNGVHTGPQPADIQFKVYRGTTFELQSAIIGIPPLEPCQSDTVIWTFHPDSPCNHHIVAKVTAIPDQDHSNDSLWQDFVVTYSDVEAISVSMPDTVDVCHEVHPIVYVHNRGVHVPASSGWVYLEIYRGMNLVMRDSVWKTLDLCVQDSAIFTYHPTIDDTCFHTAIGFVVFDPDQDHSNDTTPAKPFVVRYRDVTINSIVVPGDTVISCNSFRPKVIVEYIGSHVGEAICTLHARIWRYKIKLDSLCHISMDTTQQIVEYDTFVVVTITPGMNLESLPLYHPYWSDIKLISHHTIEVTVSMANDQNPLNNTLSKNFFVKAHDHDLQVNYLGLLLGYAVVNGDTINVGVSYNPVSVVSNSPLGPAASFRSWYKIIRERTNTVVYSRYLDRTLQPGQYACLYYYSGWVPSDSGWYTCRSYIEFRPGVDVIAINNSMERRFYARLTSTDASAKENTQGDISNLPTTFALGQNYPNPIASATMIRWQIPVQTNVRISVYDATGRIIKTLVNDNCEPGYYNTTWDCTNDANSKVSAGIYFYDMQATGYSARYKMVISR